jgi:hypothetical protein
VDALSEQSSTTTEHDGRDHQQVLVDRIGSGQRADQLAASQDH